MKLDNQIIQKLSELYMKIPDETLKRVFEESNIEKYLKGNTKQEKIKSLLTNASPHNGKRKSPICCWQHFIKTVDALLSNEDINAEENVKNYAHIICDALNNENEVLQKNKLKKIVDSEEFNDFINGDNYKIPPSGNIFNDLNININANIIYDTDIYKDNIVEEERKTMKWYLGHIEKRGTHYNFQPKFTLYNKMIEELSGYYLKDVFPIYGTINLAYKMSNQSKDFLDKLNIDKSEDDITSLNSLYAISFTEEELQDNDHDKILKKLDLQIICDNGINLSDRIKPLSELGVYKIVTAKSEIVDNDFINNLINIKEDYLVDELVLLKNDNYLYGPYNIKERSLDGQKYIKPDIGSKKYLLEYYSILEKDYYNFEKQRYNQDPIYTEVARIFSEPQVKDIVPNSILLSKLQDTINLELIKEDPDEFERLCITSPFLGDLPEKIRDSRVERIGELITNALKYEDEKKEAIATLIKNSGKDIQLLLGGAIKETREYKDLLNNNSIIRNENEEKEKLIQQLNVENEKLRNNSVNITNQKFDNDLYEKKESEYLDLENKIKALSEKHGLLKDIDDLSKKIDDLKKEKTKLDNNYEDIIGKVNDKKKQLSDLKIEEQIQIKNATNAISNGVQNIAQTAFDPYISNAMLQAAAKWSEDTEKENYIKIAEEMKNISYKFMEKEELIPFLVQGVQKFRDYEDNEIINMYICISQNFLTVFSGEPGTGKTSICNIIANSLGLNNFGIESNLNKNRFVPISVERGWSSKRDLIGYFNPLTKKYDKSNGKIFDGLMLLNEEGINSRFPYVVLLDEANLSPMEYYWTDFMRLTDRNDEDMYINIGTENDILIPKTLRFLATINNDQTTEQLSPRLIDRAWIIRLPKKFKNDILKKPCECFTEIISWENIEKTFIKSDSKEEQLRNELLKIYKCFDKRKLSVSPRVQQSIQNYVCVAQEIMIDEPGVLKKEKALDYAIVQKLLPKINGYYDNYKTLFEELIPICKDNNLNMTKAAIEEMKNFAEQEQNMGYCQYLL